jgi:hypothetical protein
MADRQRRRRRPGLIAKITLALTVAILSSELVSFIALRQLNVGDSAAQTTIEIEERATARVGTILPDEILHPYLGWVMDADASGGARVVERVHAINPYGFLDRGDPPRRSDDQEFRIAVVGGSVAWYFALDGVETFVRTLERSPDFEEREIIVLPFALSGYKQPQQFLTIAYLLSLGTEIDMVINIDGFNDVALHPFENAPKGIAIAFPRSWDARISGVPDARKAEILYRLSARLEERKAWAKRFDGIGTSMSQTLKAIWTVGDRRLANEISNDQMELSANRPQVETPFRVSGPNVIYADQDAMFTALGDLWAQSSLQLDRLCRANGIDYYHFLQPNQYVKDSKPMLDAERKLTITDDHPYREGVEQGYPVLEKQGRELVSKGVRFHDLTLLFSNTTEPTYRDNCCHYNAFGNELLATRIGEAVVEGRRADAPEFNASDKLGFAPN